MLSYDLCDGKWEMTDCSSEKKYKAAAPGSVLSVLRSAGEIADPYHGENEKELMPFLEKVRVIARAEETECVDVIGLVPFVDHVRVRRHRCLPYGNGGTAQI